MKNAQHYEFIDAFITVLAEANFSAAKITALVSQLRTAFAEENRCYMVARASEVIALRDAADKRRDNLPTGVTAVAMVAYKSGSNGLAIALADEGAMEWSTAKSTCEGKAAIGGNSWKLPSKDDWDNMITAAGDYTALRGGFTSVGGSNLVSDAYWSSTENGSDAWYYYFDEGYWNDGSKDYGDVWVRACLAF